MPEGPLGGPRPLAEPDNVLIVKTDPEATRQMKEKVIESLEGWFITVESASILTREMKFVISREEDVIISLQEMKGIEHGLEEIAGSNIVRDILVVSE